MSDGYSLLVVDDEKKAREHVIGDIAWETLSITKLYTAADGLEALETVSQKHPDIIILDIKMPGMNGIELLENIRRRKIDVQIIALSGFSDFEAARKMLTSGLVVEYLLKPASEDSMFEAVYKCIANIDEKRRVSHLKQDLSQTQAMLRRSMLQSCLFGSLQDEEDDLEGVLSADYFIQVAVISEKNPGKFRELSDRFSADEGCSLEYCFKFPDSNRKAMLFRSRSEEGLSSVPQICELFASECSGYVGLGRVYESEYNLNISYQEALLAYVSRYFAEGDRLRFIDEVESRIFDAEGSAKASKRVEALLSKGGNEEELKQAIDAVFKSFVLRDRNLLLSGGEDIDIEVLRVYFANFVDLVLKDRKEEFSISAILSAKSVDELLEVVLRTFMQHGSREKQQDIVGHKAALVNIVKDHINNNYAKHITLESASQIVYINPSYLSKIFSEEEGCGFSDYISGVRVEQAKKLLREQSRRLKIYEIAETVGYRNVKHFMRVFKKVEGSTPSEYRERAYVQSLQQHE